MLHCMDENVQGTTKKKIRVRKPSYNSSKNSLNYDDDYYIPIAASDSQWNGLKFENPENENSEHINSITDDETELKVIELEAEASTPLLLLFPELEQEELNGRSINKHMSTTDITKILVGKKPNFALLKSCKKLDNITELPSLPEISESDDSVENRIVQYDIDYLKRYRKDSRDADDSDNDY